MYVKCVLCVYLYTHMHLHIYYIFTLHIYNIYYTYYMRLGCGEGCGEVAGPHAASSHVAAAPMPHLALKYK